MAKNKTQKKSSQNLWRFIKDDKITLIILSVAGILFNVGLVFIPIFEGWLAQCLFDIINGKKVFHDMLILVVYFVVTMLFVQTMRYLKRFYVRRVSNNIGVRLRKSYYQNLLKEKQSVASSEVGEAVTNAVSDIEATAEGYRKTVTEIFDTGVLLVSYSVAMLIYDYKLALVSLLFMPIACVIAELLKKLIYREVTAYKKSSEQLSNAVFERVDCALMFRVHGRDKAKNEEFRGCVKDFEKKAVKANLWENTLQPIYNIIAMCGIVFVIFIGGRNVLGIGWSAWDIAKFTTFVACYTKLADKSSKVAKLFNTVQRAKVSWSRLKNRLLIVDDKDFTKSPTSSAYVKVQATDLEIGFGGSTKVINKSTFTAESGQIIGITGTVASGKTTLGKAFLNEFAYQGSLTINGRELKDIPDNELFDYVTYLGHSPELFSASVRDNIMMGDEGDAEKFVKIVKLDGEIAEMENGIDETVGNQGIMLSGGQQSRVALARTLAHAKSVLILDDPFSAVDKKTEKEILAEIRKDYSDRLIFIISHRLTEFGGFSKVLWIENGNVIESNHEKLMLSSSEYALLYKLQEATND